jgi:hypothetical protein
MLKRLIFNLIVLPVFSQLQQLEAQAPLCAKWSEFSQRFGQIGTGAPYRAFAGLPNGFKQGCVFFQDNNSIDIAYVLKDGIKPDASMTNGESSYGVPSFGNDKQEQFEQLTQRGQALKITWLTPTIGALSYLRSLPRNRAFIREDGMVCLQAVCMQSGGIPNIELIRLLEAGRNRRR